MLKSSMAWTYFFTLMAVRSKGRGGGVERIVRLIVARRQTAWSTHGQEGKSSRGMQPAKILVLRHSMIFG